MKKRPLLLLLCMFLAGILFVYAGFWPALLPVLPGAYAAWRWQSERVMRFFMPLLCIGLAAAGALRTESELRFREGYMQKLAEGEDVRLVGEVYSIEVKPRCVYYYLTDCVMDRSNGYVRCNDVLAYASADDYSIGQILIVRGTISLFDPAANEGSFDARDYYQSRKIDFGVRVTEASRAGGKEKGCRAFLARLRGRLMDSLLRCGAKDGILSAMLLGEKTGLDAEVKSLYQKAGISHILAISGLHVSLIGAGLYRLLRRLQFRYVTAAAATGFLMVSYAVMTGGSVSARRAVFMLLVSLAADVLGRAYDMLSALALSCIVILWENPFLIGYSGFLFSAAAVLGVGITVQVLTDWCESFDPEEEAGEKSAGLRGMWGRFRASFLGSLGIQLTTLPLVARFYCEIPVYAMLLNLFVLALVKYVVVLGALAAAVGLFCVPAGTLLLYPCSGLLTLYEEACQRSLALPGARMITGCPEGWRIMAYYAVLGFVLFVMKRRAMARRSRRGMF